MRYCKFLIFLFLLLGCIPDHSAQEITIKSIYNLTKSTGDDLCPAWSQDGSMLVFQSNRNGNWDLLVYKAREDTVTFLTNFSSNEQHPVWINNGKKVAYDADADGWLKIYTISAKGAGVALLFDRDLQAREPSFSASEKLVYFSGFDELKNRWEIYSYEFYFNNLNRLTSLPEENHSPRVSPNTDYVLFENYSMEFPQQQLHLVNWYGNPEKKFPDFNVSDPSWAPGGLKIFFVSNMDNQPGEVYSMWMDGSHLERLTNDTLEVKNPVLSPDGKFMAISVKLEDGFDIFLIPLEDY